MLGRQQVWSAALVGVAACSGEPLPPPLPPPDTRPPSLAIEFPTPVSYDENGDSLVDVRVVWADSGGAIDLSTATLRGPVSGSSAEADVLSTWQVEGLSTNGLIAHETIDGLLTGGPITLTVSVSDTAGNVATASVLLALPHGVYLKTITTGIGAGPSQRVTVCDDDHRVYMTGARNIIVADADALSLIGVYRDSSAADWLNVPLCVPGDSILYVTVCVQRFNRHTLRWLPDVDGCYWSYAIAQSRRDPNLLYVGETGPGGVALIDRALNRRIGSLPLPPAVSDPAYVWGVVPNANDAVLYIARSGDGILVFRPVLGTVTAVIGDPIDALTLSRDERILWGLRESGFAEYETRSNTQVRFYHISAIGQHFAVSPSERRAFITTQDRSVWDTLYPGDNLLFDIPTWTVLTTFPRPHPPDVWRWDGGVAFHPNGKLIFVGHDRNIDVYLNRE